MRLKLIATVILVGFYGDRDALPGISGSALNGTASPVNRDGSWNPSNSRDAAEYSSYLHHENDELLRDNAAAEISHESYQDNRNQDHYDSTYDDHKTKVHLLLQPEEKVEGHPLCPKLFRFSLLGLILSMLLIFNGIVTGATLYKTVHGATSASTINTITNVNTNDNTDINTNDNTNINENYNDNFLGRRRKRTIPEGSCGCPKSRGEGSKLFPSEESLRGAWTVAQDFLSENQECASRMACEAASFFVPSSVSPLLTVLPSKMEGTRSLLMSAAAGNCAVAYDACPFSLVPGRASLVDWM
ncbi:uncharacterized protein LOC135196079 [Macrobrachium nipponense]|uniref:uncharacterized protein LOC135196079 n=1 Tax=Macrobrachium nipponense TaxID=159736 RepID=UPI0030C812D2